MRLRGISLVAVLAIVTCACGQAAGAPPPSHAVAPMEVPEGAGRDQVRFHLARMIETGAHAATEEEGSLPPSVQRGLNRSLAAHLDRHPGRFSVAVYDRTTSVRYAFRESTPFMLASVAKVDILLALLLLAQREERPLTDGERRLAGQMIRQSDNDSAHRLYTAIGGNQGLSDTLRRLGIAHTRPGPGSSWGLTRSSPSDQVKVLEKLTDPAGPVSARNRRYALSLMSSVDRTQAWGVSAAASGGRVALKNGWLPARVHGGLWTINSVGRLALPGHELLIAVLSERSQDMSAGVSLVERVARTAVRAFTGVRTPLTSPRPLSEHPPGPPTVGVRLAHRDLCPAAGCQAWPVDTNQPAPPGSRADR